MHAHFSRHVLSVQPAAHTLLPANSEGIQCCQAISHPLTVLADHTVANAKHLHTPISATSLLQQHPDMGNLLLSLSWFLCVNEFTVIQASDLG